MHQRIMVTPVSGSYPAVPLTLPSGLKTGTSLIPVSGPLWGFSPGDFSSQRFWDHMGMLSDDAIETVQQRLQLLDVRFVAAAPLAGVRPLAEGRAAEALAMVGEELRAGETSQAINLNAGMCGSRSPSTLEPETAFHRLQCELMNSTSLLISFDSRPASARPLRRVSPPGLYGSRNVPRSRP